MYSSRQPIYPPVPPVYSDSVTQWTYLNNQHPNAEPLYLTPITPVFQMPLEDQHRTSTGRLTRNSDSIFIAPSPPPSGSQPYSVNCYSEEQSPTWNSYHALSDGQTQYSLSNSTRTVSPSNRRQSLSTAHYSEPTSYYPQPTTQYARSTFDGHSYLNEEYDNNNSGDSSSPDGYDSASRGVSDLSTKGITYVVHEIRVGSSNVTCLLARNMLPDVLPRSFRPPSHGHMNPQGHHPTFEIRRAGDKGKGVFCMSSIPEGTHIFAEHPLVVCAAGAPFEQLFERLGDLVRDEVLSLSNTQHHDQLDGLINTNAMAIDLVSSSEDQSWVVTHRALFSIASRCNHSCSPNAHWVWDLSSFSLSLRAVRSLQAGEEITISYIPPAQSIKERKAQLQMAYGFQCHCDACSIPIQHVKDSDSARQFLKDFWTTVTSFEDWCADLSMPEDAVIKEHAHALHLIEREDLQVLEYGKHLDVIAMCYGVLGHENMFRFWVEKMARERVVRKPEHAIVFQRWCADPRSFGAWGWRTNGVFAKGSRRDLNCASYLNMY